MSSSLFESNIFSETRVTDCRSRGQALCRYDTIGLMRAIQTVLVAMLCLLAWGQIPADEPVTVSADHPRLFLRPQRLRLLRRERERSSMRWQQFAALVAGSAPLPERGFAQALYYQVAGDGAVGKQAVASVLAAGADLRQMAIVYDWC